MELKPPDCQSVLIAVLLIVL